MTVAVDLVEVVETVFDCLDAAGVADDSSCDEAEDAIADGIEAFGLELVVPVSIIVEIGRFRPMIEGGRFKVPFERGVVLVVEVRFELFKRYLTAACEFVDRLAAVLETLDVLVLVLVALLLQFVSPLPDLASEAMRLEVTEVKLFIPLPLALARLDKADFVVPGICGIEDVDEGRGVLFRLLLLPKSDDDPGTRDTRVFVDGVVDVGEIELADDDVGDETLGGLVVGGETLAPGKGT